MHNITKISVNLYIFSYSLSPDEIASVIGMTDGYARLCKGENRNKITAIWSVYSQLDKHLHSLEEHCENLMMQLEPYSEKIKGLSKNHDIVFGCAIYSLNGRPPIHFDRNILEKINMLGAELDIDLYIAPESKLFNWDAEELQ